MNDSSGSSANRIKLGTSQDLELYHSGSNSYIKDSGTGYLLVLASGFAVQNAAGSETIMSMVEDGAVDLYYNDSKKFETTSQGVNLEGNGSDHYILDIHNTGSGKGSQMRFRNDHDASANIGILGDTTGDLRIYTEKNFRVDHGSDNAIKSIKDGAVQLYYDGANVLETGSDHITVQGSGNDAGGVSYIKFKSGNGSHRANIGKTSGANGRLYIMNLDNDSVEFGTSGSTKLELQNAGHLIPGANNSYNLGGTSNRWANVYTNDLNLSNEGKTNDVDGTWGDYTIQEGESDLFLINNRSGKKYKFNLTEVS